MISLKKLVRKPFIFRLNKLHQKAEKQFRFFCSAGEEAGLAGSAVSFKSFSVLIVVDVWVSGLLHLTELFEEADEES